MSLREELIYAQMVAAGETEPINRVFFFPTKADARIARKWLARDIVSHDDTWPLATALRLVAGRNAVPLAMLQIVRWLDKEDGLPVDRKADVWADAADRAAVDADNARLDKDS